MTGKAGGDEPLCLCAMPGVRGVVLREVRGVRLSCVRGEL